MSEALHEAIERYRNSGGFEVAFPEVRDCVESLCVIAQAYFDRLGADEADRVERSRLLQLARDAADDFGTVRGSIPREYWSCEKAIADNLTALVTALDAALKGGS